MLKLGKTCVGIFLALGFLCASHARAEIVGDTYSFAMLGYDLDANRQLVASDFVLPVQTHTFLGDIDTPSIRTIGASAYGNPDDVIRLQENFSILADGTRRITLNVFAWDEQRNFFTNWFADNSVTSETGSPFEVATFEFGAFSGGNDSLNPLFTPIGGATDWRLTRANFSFFGDRGTNFFYDGPGSFSSTSGIPFLIDNRTDATGIKGSAYVVLDDGGDLSTHEFSADFTGDQEFSGFRITIEYVPTPEPSLSILAALGLACSSLIRRKL